MWSLPHISPFLDKDEEMKKLLLGVIFIAATASAQSTNICVNSTGDSRAPLCDANNYLDVAVMSVIPGTSATSLGKAEDAAHASGDAGVASLAIRSDTLGTAANIAGTAGDYMGLQTDALGALWVDNAGSTNRVCVTIVPDTNAFAANDIIGAAGGGSGLITFSSMFRGGTLSGVLSGVSVVNSEIDGIAFDMCLFNGSPSSSTTTVNGAFTLAAADKQKLLTCFAISDGRAFAAYELYQANALNIALDSPGTSLFAILRTTGAPTWAADQTVDVCATVIQD